MLIGDLELREQTLFEVYNSKTYSETQKALLLATDNINKQIIKTKDVFTKKKLNLILANIEKEISIPYKKLNSKLLNETVKISNVVHEAFTLNKTPVKVISDIVNGNRLIQGYKFKDLTKATEDNHVRQLKRVVGAGVAEGKRSDQIVQNVNIKNEKLTEAQLNNVIYTSISESRANTRHDSFKELERVGVIKGYEYVATLDGRTSEYCRNHDGNKYYKNIDKIDYLINTHFHCRSVFAPINENVTKRASATGQIDNMSYSEWFDTQEPSFQKKVLGKKYNAFLTGTYIISSFLNIKELPKTLTISDIENNLIANPTEIINYDKLDDRTKQKIDSLPEEYESIKNNYLSGGSDPILEKMFKQYKGDIDKINIDFKGDLKVGDTYYSNTPLLINTKLNTKKLIVLNPKTKAFKLPNNINLLQGNVRYVVLDRKVSGDIVYIYIKET